MPDYYGTGRQPKCGRSYVGLAVALVVILVAVSVIPFVIPRPHKMQEAPSERPEERNLTIPRDDTPEPQQQIAVCGMLICELDDYQKNYWDLPSSVIVGQVDANSTAAHAGILPGDVIVRIGDSAPDCAETCRTLLTAYKDGEQVPIDLYRSGEELQIELNYEAE